MEVIFILGKKNKLLNLSIQSWVIAIIASAVAAIIITFIYNLLSVTVTEVDRSRLKQLNQENEVVRRELRRIEAAIHDLDRVIDSLESYDRNLRVYASLKPINQSVVEYVPPSGDTTLVSLKNLNELSKVLDDLMSRAELQRRSYIELLDHLDEKKFLRDHTPSIPPVQGWFVSGFGYRLDPFTGTIKMHAGIDIAGPISTPICAPASGTVKAVEEKLGFGLTVEIDHGNNCTTFYAHCQRSVVSTGATVKRGDIIAFLGDTGKSTGPHVHYEVRVSGEPVNPMNYIITSKSIID